MADIVHIADSQDYQSWVAELKQRYLTARLRASLAVTSEMLHFYWSVGRDIASKQWTNKYGTAFYKTLSQDLRSELPDVKGLSETNLKYMYYFYILYSERIENRQQGVDDLTLDQLCTIPWSHHLRILEKCKGNVDKAIFYVKKVQQNNWSRDMLLNFLKADMYGREGKAVSNFSNTLPALQGDLASQITKDPYNFDFLTLNEGFKEKELEDALIENVTRFLLELGTGFAFMGRQIRLGIGDHEIFPDLLFYNTRIHAYCVVELKAGSFKAEYLGQLGLYVSTINHQMKGEQDNPTIGLLICRDKDNVMAQYALESISQQIGISEFQLSTIYPADFKGTLPTIEEIEKGISK